ncbi:hypothetical protein ACFQI7_12970 [Paenibacillus allorhizosphaerae]|uniref:ParA family protein n=1 Tax=Paenibacillus allorhizosphaerae TaxID=2849866 RepID=A0ABM8VL97_9BACL|nr:hypothetical protein [Paenibacillus allorhizosphaerae]CAG7648190.1 hypothetical protein PAECIP111802_04147 [Paenibacillus allorhizosphaerae]
MCVIAKMTLLLLDSDAYFGDMLSAYIRSSDYAARFTIRCFRSFEQGIRFVVETKEPFILLIHESWLPLPDEVYRIKLGCTVIISNQQASQGLLEYPVLCKYQPLDQLLSAVIAHYNEYSVSDPLRGMKGTKVVAVYSTTGGAGKTLTAVHLAQQLTLQGERAGCLSLEMLPSRAWYPSEGAASSEAFSSLLYYAKTNPQQIAGRLEKWKLKHPSFKFDYIPPTANAAEWREMDGADAKAMIGGIAAAGMYDVLVVDLDSFPNEVTQGVLTLADRVIWLLLDDYVYLQKTEEMLERWKRDIPALPDALNNKRIFVQNKRTGDPLNDFNCLGLTVDGILPYVPEWKAFTRVEHMYNSAFAQAAAELLVSGGKEVALACGP